MSLFEFFCLMSLIFFFGILMNLRIGMKREIKRLWKAVEVEGGPFVTANIRFPKKLMKVFVDKTILEKFHVHRMTPARIIHLLHIFKQFSNVPKSAILISADMNLSRDVWELVLSDDSFDDLAEDRVIPVLNPQFNSCSGLTRAGVNESECPTCVMDSMSNLKGPPGTGYTDVGK
jgi:hypothetical protein